MSPYQAFELADFATGYIESRLPTASVRAWITTSHYGSAEFEIPDPSFWPRYARNWTLHVSVNDMGRSFAYGVDGFWLTHLSVESKVVVVRELQKVIANVVEHPIEGGREGNWMRLLHIARDHAKREQAELDARNANRRIIEESYNAL